EAVTFPIDMMEFILVYVRHALANARKGPMDGVDVGQCERMEKSIREDLIKKREEILRDPAAVQVELQKMFDKVEVLQNCATVVSAIGTLTQVIDGLGNITFWGAVTGKNTKYLALLDKIYPWRQKWHKVYLYYSSDLLRDDD